MTQSDWLTHSAITLAQEGAPSGGMVTENSAPASATQEGAGDGSGQTGTPSGGFPPVFLIALLALFGVMIFTQISAGRKEKRKKAEMMASLGKHDKVQTIGGIIGSVVEIKGDEVTLKVDEASNTRIRVSRSAVQQILKSRGTPETAPLESSDV